MIFFNQADGNNVDVSSGYQADGTQKSPNYNMKMGFANGKLKFFQSNARALTHEQYHAILRRPGRYLRRLSFLATQDDDPRCGCPSGGPDDFCCYSRQCCCYYEDHFEGDIYLA